MPREKRDARLELPPLELDCIRALWALGEGSVHSVREHLLRDRPLAYTTVMTILGRLTKKGAAERFKRSRAYFYRPAVTEGQVRRQAVQRLLAEHFAGSQKALIAYIGSENEIQADIPPAATGPLSVADPARRGPTPAERGTHAESAIDEALL